MRGRPDMRSEPAHTPTAACSGLLDTATFFGLPRLGSTHLVQCVHASHLSQTNFPCISVTAKNASNQLLISQRVLNQLLNQGMISQ